MAKTTTSTANLEAANELTHQFRVYHTNEQTMGAMRAARDAANLKNAEFIALALGKLGQLQDELLALGFGKTNGRKAIRLPMIAQQLDQLKLASERTGVPASDLLMICLLNASKGHFTEAAPKATKKASKPDLTVKAPASRKVKKAAPVAAKKHGRKGK